MPLGSRQRSVVRVIVMTYPATSCPQMDYILSSPPPEPHSSPSFPGFLFSPSSPLSLSPDFFLCVAKMGTAAAVEAVAKHSLGK